VEALLGEFGVHVHARLFPQLDGRDLDALNRAALWVSTPWAPMVETIGSSLEAAGVQAMRLAAPYGVDGTHRWVSRILEALGQPAPSREAWDEVVARRAPGLAPLRTQAAAMELGFVVPEPCLAEVAAGEFFFGLEPFAFLRDLGFRLSLVTTRYLPGSPEPDLGALLRTGTSDGITLLRKRPGERVVDAVRRATAPLFYTDYPADARLAAAGRMPFNSRQLEPGLEGAARTAERLVRLARVPFFARYREFVGEVNT
jgi:hypothetical protein